MNNTIEENNLFYSSDAIAVKHSFYNKKVMVYVEGINDITFWDRRLRKKLPPSFYQIEDVKGKLNFKKYIEEVKKGTSTNTIIACDTDYTPYESEIFSHPCIIKTFGHSIENTMFCPNAVACYMYNLLETEDDYLSKINHWLVTFCQKAKLLLPYDICPATYGDKPQVFKKGFHYFLTSQKSIDLDTKKIKDYITSIENIFDEEQLKTIQNQIDADSKELRLIIQGHFFATGIMNYIRYVIKEIKGQGFNLSNESMYKTFSECQCNEMEACVDKQFIDIQIEKAYEYYNVSH